MPPSGKEKNSEYVALMNWPEMWFWDYHQKKLFEKSFNFKIKSKTVGPIPFSTISKSINETKKLKYQYLILRPTESVHILGFQLQTKWV